MNKKPSETDLTSSAAVASFEKVARAYTAKIPEIEKWGTDHGFWTKTQVQVIAPRWGRATMPRRPRIILPGVSLRVIQRGNNRHACFYAEDDYLAYLGWLEEYARHSGCAVRAYVLMTNHVHILFTPRSKESAGDLMKRLGQRYVQ